MLTEIFFDNLLNFGSEWKVEKIQHNSETDEVDIYVKWVGELKQNLGEKIYDYREARRWRHLDILQYKTFISARIPRVKDSSGKVRSLDVPWADSMERHTFLFERSVIDLLLACKNQTKVADLMRCGFNVVNRIIHLSTKRGIERRDEEKLFEQLSIDEKSFQKGHNYISVLSRVC
jgi:transposase